MNKKTAVSIIVPAAAVLLTGCSNLTQTLSSSASGKNLDINGYALLTEAEMANAQTATPQGRLIIGNMSYKSRKVGIPADQKTPNSGYFRAVARTTLFGTSETTVEYDFTAASTQDLQQISAIIQEQKNTGELLLKK